MIVEDANLVDLRRTVTDLRESCLDVLSVLTAARPGTVSRRHVSQRRFDTCSLHFTQCVRQQGVPVAVAPVNRHVDPVLVEFRPQGRNQLATLAVNRTDAAEVLVMLSDFQQPLARDAATACDIFEKRHYIVRPFRTSKRDKQNRVVAHC